MASRSSQMPPTGAYSWSAGSMATAVWRAGAPGSSSASGMPWPRLHQPGSAGSKPRRLASVVTKMTPVRGTSRNAENVGSAVPGATGSAAAASGFTGAVTRVGPGRGPEDDGVDMSASPSTGHLGR